jgi:hypothetical protein
LGGVSAKKARGNHEQTLGRTAVWIGIFSKTCSTDFE